MATSWEETALDKLTKVLGAGQARAVMAKGLADAKLTSLQSADDLYRFAAALSTQQGFAASVGALLSLHAVMRGAKGSVEPPAQRR